MTPTPQYTDTNLPNNQHKHFDQLYSEFRSYIETADADGSAMLEMFEALDNGKFDNTFRATLDANRVYLTTSCHLLCLTLRYRLQSILSRSFYKVDATRYVRTNLLIQKIMGFERMTLGWPVYAFGAELMGQSMMYPDDHAPGADPGDPLLSLDDYENIPDFDRDCEISTVVSELIVKSVEIAGIVPIAHLPAPYSLAAEVVGQENLIIALSNEPAKVNRFIANLTKSVLAPWCEELNRVIPGVWLELSDASGSPMFIGPENFVNIAVPPVAMLRDNADWGDRVIVANYRGDTAKPARARKSRRGQVGKPTLPFELLLDAKRLCSPHYLTRLEADKGDLSDYENYVIAKQMSLYCGIGSSRLDRNSFADRDSHWAELKRDIIDRISAVSRAAIIHRKTIAEGRQITWPGGLFMEDTNAETDFILLDKIVEEISAAPSYK